MSTNDDIVEIGQRIKINGNLSQITSANLYMSAGWKDRLYHLDGRE